MHHIFKALTILVVFGLMSHKAIHAADDANDQPTDSGLSATGNTPVSAEKSPGRDFRAVEADIRTAVDAGKIPSAAFAIAKNGEVIHANAFGWADKEQRLPSTVHTPYPLASVSKPVIATALMVLNERGVIDLDRPARDYAGGWLSGSSSDFSVRQLLNHTSGLGTYARIYWADREYPMRSLEASVRKYAFSVQPPGVISEYSNLGYGLLGHIISNQSRMSLRDVLEEELFAKLGMENSMLVNAFSTPEHAARKYDVRGNSLADTYNDTPGAGNIYASAHDMAIFGAFHLSDQDGDQAPILSVRRRQLMRSFVDSSAIYPYYGGSFYGLGWYFRTNAQGEKVVWHEGGMPGASTIIIMLPVRKIVVAVVINATNRNAQSQIFANALIKAVEPDFQVTSFDAVEGFENYTGQSEFRGRWTGSIIINGAELPWALEFEDNGPVHAKFPGHGSGNLFQDKVTFPALINGDLVIGTFGTTLPALDISQPSDNYLLLRLLRRGDKLSGAVVAYATGQRLEHLYPFEAHLSRETP